LVFQDLEVYFGSKPMIDTARKCRDHAV